MNDREFEATVGRWLTEAAPREAPDRLVEIVADRTRPMQQIGTPWRWRRLLPSGPFVRVAQVAAVLALAFIAGIAFDKLQEIGSQRPPAATSGPQPSAFAVPARPTDIPTDGSCQPERVCMGVLTAGVYRSPYFDPPVRFEIAEGTWVNTTSSGGVVDLQSLDYPGDEITLYQRAVPRTADDRAVAGVDDTVGDFISWITSRSDLDVTRPVSTSVGGLEGLWLDLSVRPDAPHAIQACPSDPCVMVAYGIQGPVMPTWFWHLEMWHGAATRLYVLDGGTERILIAITAWDGSTLSDTVERAQPIIDSLRFGRSG